MLHQDCFKEFDQTSSILIRFLHGITKMSQKFRPASRGAFPEGYYENPGSEAALRRSRAYGESIAYTLRNASMLRVRSMITVIFYSASELAVRASQ